MVKCDGCGKDIFFKKFYIYPGTKKGSLKISEEKIVCKACFLAHTVGAGDFEKDGNAALGQALIRKNYKEALRVLEQCFDEKNPREWHLKGGLMEKLEYPLEKTLKCYDEVLKLDSHSVKAWYRKGHVLFSMERYKESARCFENVVTLEGGGNIGRILTGWGFLALFSSMMSWVYASNKLTNEGKFSKKLHQTRTDWVKKCHPLLTNVMPVFKDDEGKIKYITLVPPMSNLKEFVDYCQDNFYEILESIEPRIFSEFTETGQRH